MNKKSLVFLILALLLGLVLGVGGTFGAQKFIFKTSAQTTLAESTAKKGEGFLPIGEFTVNLQGGSFLKTNITVQVTDVKTEEKLKEEDALLKDRVNTVLAGKSLTDVQTPAAREKLREELVHQLNEVADNKITDVLFLSMVYQ